MADEDDDGPKYVFITENEETKTTSRGYSGKAVAMYPNGDTYDGEFMDGTREGRGVYTYAATVEKYDGEWKNNLKHGIGKMTYSKAGVYNGFWENGRRHGEGVFTYSNQDIYSGWWKFGEKEGTACYTFANGMKLYGEWWSGAITKGKWIYPNGMYYEGEFENNKPKGKGRWVFKNGNILEGDYEQKPKEMDEDEEPAEDEEEDAIKKPKFVLEWHSKSNISEAAYKVNSVEQ